MSSTSATRLYAEGDVVRCGLRDGRRPCKRVILKGGKIADERGHEFSIAELLHAAHQAGQTTVDDVLREYYALSAVPVDPLADYRQIKNLIVIGSAELDFACHGAGGENPLNLQSGWIPDVPVPADMDRWIRSLTWRDGPEWQTRAALVLTPPMIGGIPTSLIGQNKIWGVPHDSLPGGLVRQDVFWSNYFLQPNHGWAKELPADQWQWMLAYEHPRWTTKLNWTSQKNVVNHRGMTISTVAQDAFALNAVLAATGIRLRSATWSRTSTIFDDFPLFVCSGGRGVVVDQCWNTDGADGSIAASVQGVPGLGH